MKFNDWIIFEDEHLVALNKPAGLLSIPDREGKEMSLKAILQDRYPAIFTVHRLDKETSGLILFAKSAEAHKHLSQQFEERQTKKIYTGLILGAPNPIAGTVKAPIAEHPVKKGVMTVYRKGKESITDYETIETYGLFSWMRFQIHTGRTHQIRVHLKEIGHPIVGDELYGDGKPILLSSIKSKFKLSKNEEEEKPLLNRLALHAWQLEFVLPSGNHKSLEAALPKDIRATLQQLTKWRKNK